jgi:hypothetical protein
MTDLAEYEKRDRSSLCVAYIYTHSLYIYSLLQSINYMYLVIMLKIVKATGSLSHDINNKSLLNF